MYDSCYDQTYQRQPVCISMSRAVFLHTAYSYLAATLIMESVDTLSRNDPDMPIIQIKKLKNSVQIVFLTSIHALGFCQIYFRNDLKKHCMYTAQLDYVKTGCQFLFEAQYNLSPWFTLQC